MNPVTPCLQLPCPPYHTDRQVDWIQRQTWGSQTSTDMDSRSPGIWSHTEWKIFTDVSEILATSIFESKDSWVHISIQRMVMILPNATSLIINTCEHYRHWQDQWCARFLTGSKSKRCVPPLVYLQLPSLKKYHMKVRSQFSVSMESSLKKCRELLVI